MRKIVFLLLLSLSCIENKNFDDGGFELYLRSHWIFAKNINSNFNQKAQDFSPIKRPQATWLLLASADFTDNKRDCLFYFVPYKENDGKIKIISTDQLNPCDNLSLKEGQYEMQGLSELSYAYIRNEEHQLVRSRKISPLTFTLKMKLRGDENEALKIEVPIFNGKPEEEGQRFKYRLYFSSAPYGKFQDFDVFSSLPNQQLSGSWDDRYSSKNAIKCSDLDDRCQMTGANECQKCRFGYFEAFKENCSSSSVKFCGLNRCGEKSEPACLRGFDYDLKKSKTNEGHLAFYCQDDLVPTVDENGLLVCLY